MVLTEKVERFVDNQKRVKQSWSIRLGLIQAVVLLGIVTGSMLCAFYLGLVSGQKAGFETAQSINLASVAKLPIPDQYRQEELDSVASQVYAKLSSPESIAVPEEADAPVEATDLKPIDVKKVVRPSEDRSDPIEHDALAAKEADEYDKKNVIRILSEPPQSKEIEKTEVKKNGVETLGSLKNKSEDHNEDLSVKNIPSKEESKEVGDVSVLASLSEEPVSETSGIKVVKGYREEDPKELPQKIEKKVDTGTAKVTIKETKPVQPVVEPKVEKVIPPPAQKSFVKNVLSKGWYAQVAAPGKLDDANNLAKKLKESGFPVVIETANIRGQEYYRVLVGPEDEQRYSQTMVQQLKRESYLRGDPFLRRVK